jgi:hypothetical protein
MTAIIKLKKNTSRESQGVFCQEELVGGKPPIVK